MNESIERLAAAGFVETLSLVAQRRRSLAQNKLDERSAVLGEPRDWAREVGGALPGGCGLLGADWARGAGVSERRDCSAMTAAMKLSGSAEAGLRSASSRAREARRA